jgi:hypothetical protein
MQPKRLPLETNLTEWDVRLEPLPECSAASLVENCPSRMGVSIGPGLMTFARIPSTRKLCRPGPNIGAVGYWEASRRLHIVQPAISQFGTSKRNSG